MSDDDDDLLRRLTRSIKGEITRSRDTLVPPAFQFLWESKRFIVPYGGRASAKSWSVARVLLVRGTEQKHLILCARESQSSIKESAYRLLCDQVRALDLEDFYTIGADKLTGRNGTEIIFEGLFRNAERLKSYEGVTLCWVEEAHRVSERSWEDLIPTIRKPGSQIYITFNPSQADDPVWQRFIASMRPDVIARRVSWRDNPFLSAETIAEKDWCAATDMDQFRHVWEGEFRTVTDAQVLRGKYVAQMFDINPQWSGPYFGLDFGFSQDPTAATACYIDDQERVLYVAREFWKLGADIDALPTALEAQFQVYRAMSSTAIPRGPNRSPTWLATVYRTPGAPRNGAAPWMMALHSFARSLRSSFIPIASIHLTRRTATASK